jgi:hypothetical protein
LLQKHRIDATQFARDAAVAECGVPQAGAL